ncbi:MAG TPA: DUF1932 domain-containing protein [Mycobacteriales bacterium]|nr:DUF1932 domain-containing protein [Mycobacteriales bacterium]
MTTTTIGIYSPGAMGSALGRAWRDEGCDVVTTVAGRSERTRSLAENLTTLPDLEAVVAAADLVVSIGPPAEAVAMSREIAAACVATGSQPRVADLNAISPATVARIAAVLVPAGCELIDGSISGGPPRPGSTTHLYLSGPSADTVVRLRGVGLASKKVGDRIGTASAVKMSTAAVYKGFTALIVQALRTAYANDVLDIVLADLSEEFGQLIEDAATRIAMAASKASRYVGEMHQIADTQEAAGARPELYDAMAVVYESLAATDLATLTPEAAADSADLPAALDRLVPAR